MKIFNDISTPGKKFALLIDPDKYTVHSLIATLYAAEELKINYILVGGSLVSDQIDCTIEIIKKHTNIPVLLFPGSLLQLSNKADAILLLSLISGRNPDYLIGNHVLAAPYLKKSGLEIIPTGYILVGEGNGSSVEYISNTKPIPSHKHDLVIATALAGELIGNKIIYLESGSGANQPASPELIRKVKQNISLPLIVGGGLKSPEQVYEISKAGADVVVIGNAVEKSLEVLASLVKAARNH
ncbi:MAG: geranylgeranylglyceryl/heptaprenylglyceryl phosphate synthase [Bacteroidales bacterium]|nr:geranylgeranylglyceryl/heptaprenylglyceryl phosphate synthase [Bacteroidales bacterium]